MLTLTFRLDLRDPSTTPLNFTRSINLALSERGVNSLRFSEDHELLQNIVQETIPMHGRMIHGRSADGTLFEESQAYDVQGRVSVELNPPLFGLAIDSS